jgi:hypothetical protein
MDDQRVGVTPVDLFISPGPHQIVLQYRDLIPSQLTVEQAPQVIGSLFSYARLTIDIPMKIGSTEAFLARAVEDYSRWSLVPPEAKDHPIKPVLRQRISIALACAPELSEADYLEVFQASAAHIGSLAMFDDWLQAWSLVFRQSATPQALAILGRYQISNLLAYQEVLRQIAPGAVISNSPIDLPSITPRPVSDGPQFMGRKLDSISLNGRTVYLDSKPVDQTLYARFLADHPEWAVEGIHDLLAQGLVESNYLFGFDQENPISASPISYVSYRAAQAFLAWFTIQLQANPQFDGYLARLPFFEEAELVQGLNQSPIFEWTLSSASFRQSQEFTDRAAVLRFPGFQRRVIGGSQVLLNAGLAPDSPCAAPLEWCTGNIGFRIWLFLKERS